MSEVPQITSDTRGDPAAKADAPEMTPEQLAEAREYGRRSLCCDLADKGLDVAFLAVMAIVFAVPLDAFLDGWIPSDMPRLLAIFLITTLLHMAVSFPLSLYSGYALEHRYGLSRQTLSRWLVRYAKRNLLAIVFGLVLVCGLYAIIWTVGGWWWLAPRRGFL